MGSKNSKNAKTAQKGAKQLSDNPVPSPTVTPVQTCVPKHWIGVRVVDEAGKPVPGIKVTLKLTDGTNPTITTDSTGSYTTTKTLDAGNCEISFPDLFDLEWNPQ